MAKVEINYLLISISDFNRTFTEPVRATLRKIKDMAKDLKSNRQQFVFTKKIKELLQDNSESLGESKNEIVGDAIFLYLTDSNNFVSCPKCRANLWSKVKLHPGGIAEKKCRCGNHVVIETDNFEYLKGKN